MVGRKLRQTKDKLDFSRMIRLNLCIYCNLNLRMVEPHHKFIRSDQVAYKVNNKKSIYNACSRNGYLMPPFNDPITTFEFCDMVRLKTLWLPKAEDCKGYTCVDKPTKFELA